MGRGSEPQLQAGKNLNRITQRFGHLYLSASITESLLRFVLPTVPRSMTTPNIYKIPLMCLAGQMSCDKSLAPPPSPQPQTLLSPLVPSTDRTRTNTQGKRSPLVRTKKTGPMACPSTEVCNEDNLIIYHL